MAEAGKPTVNDEHGQHNQGNQCCCPKIAVYLISTNCLTVHNGACPDWEFCKWPCKPSSP